MKIYTKTGDDGTTGLYGGKRVNKDDIQIEAYGTVDELNSFLGLLISKVGDLNVMDELKPIQSALFDIGSHLASDPTKDLPLPKINESWIDALEQSIDRLHQDLPVLKTFILPGGNERIALAHVCRTVSRRAERRVVAFSNNGSVDPLIVRYLNRLSDYFFSLARFLAFKDGIDEVKWNPK